MIIYFSGTGNSRFVASRIASKTPDELLDAAPAIRAGKGVDFTDSNTFVFVAPVYAAAPPLVFMDFIRKSRFPIGSKAYFIMTCAVSMSASPDYCRKIALEKDLVYMGTMKINMPQNYLVYFKMGTLEKNERIIGEALPVIDRVTDAICSGHFLPKIKVKTWERLLTPVILKIYFKLLVSAKAFEATDNCVGCGKCVLVCPLGNISMQGEKPVWGSRCTHCMACINLCPKEAIEYGKRTQGKLRYHGPDSIVKSY